MVTLLERALRKRYVNSLRQSQVAAGMLLEQPTPEQAEIDSLIPKEWLEKANQEVEKPEEILGEASTLTGRAKPEEAETAPDLAALLSPYLDKIREMNAKKRLRQ